MDNSNSFFIMESLNDLSSSFEFSQYPPATTATPGQLPKKPCQQQEQQQEQQEQQLKDKYYGHRPQYPDDLPGTINFDLSVFAGVASNAGTYSKKLKRIYIPTNQALRVYFTWSPTFQPLYLRSAVLYVDDYYVSTPVQRCYAHRGPELPYNAGVGYNQLKYIFKVSDPANIYKTSYETDVNAILTTKTALKPDEGNVCLDYTFFCQNSCPTGINRRATKLIFLVEDDMGVVVAKRSVLIQICTNAKRDKARDENRVSSDSTKSKTRKPSQPPLPPVDSEKNNCDENETVYTVNVDIVGEENYKAVLQYAYGVLAAQAFRTGNHQLVKPHMDAILKKESEG